LSSAMLKGIGLAWLGIALSMTPYQIAIIKNNL